MPYVSCMYAPPDPTRDENLKAGENARIICTDENGVEWRLTEDSQVGDWLRFKDEDGEVLAYEAPEPEPEEDEDAT